ncbi:hypothetical protein Riv7116_6545 [Rivularia sp. PCC 7116]|nr:hypothetical protein Riv7116_6545 [Rivularia sp. PCC 7116]
MINTSKQEFYVIQDLRNCHNVRLVRDTENIVTTFAVTQSVTAPYKKNVPVA